MAYARARQLMKLNRNCLDDLATNALERETLTREDLDEIFAAHELRRTLLPTDEDEAEDTSVRRRFEGPGSLLPQRSSEKPQKDD
jgi:hypothetical protein